jgi:hypothetical protein
MKRPELIEFIVQYAKSWAANIEPEILDAFEEDDDDHPAWMPLRLRSYFDGDLSMHLAEEDPLAEVCLHCGDPSMDTDHRGWIASESIYTLGNDDDLRAKATELVEFLIQELEDDVCVFVGNTYESIDPSIMPDKSVTVESVRDSYTVYSSLTDDAGEIIAWIDYSTADLKEGGENDDPSTYYDAPVFCWNEHNQLCHVIPSFDEGSFCCPPVSGISLGDKNDY